MAVLVVLAGKALDVVIACRDGALLWALVLMGEHVRLQVLEDFAALWVGATSLFFRLVAAKTFACVRLMRRQRRSSCRIRILLILGDHVGRLAAGLDGPWRVL